MPRRPDAARPASTADVLEAWQRDLEYANLSGTFYMGMTMFAAVGRKP